MIVPLGTGDALTQTENIPEEETMRVTLLASFAVLMGIPIAAHAQAAADTPPPPADTMPSTNMESTNTASTNTASTNTASTNTATPQSGKHLACAPVKVHFALDSDQLYDQEKPLLDRTADCLQHNAQQRVSIVGNADERGTQEYNQDLGQRRAQTVARYIEGKGVSSNQVEAVISHGEDSPICTASDLKCWQLNRRTAVRQSCHL